MSANFLFYFFLSFDDRFEFGLQYSKSTFFVSHGVRSGERNFDLTCLSMLKAKSDNGLT
jgi:hypothetical protein